MRLVKALQHGFCKLRLMSFVQEMAQRFVSRYNDRKMFVFLYIFIDKT